MQKSFSDLFIANLVTIYFLLTAAMRGGAWERGLGGRALRDGRLVRDAAFKLSLIFKFLPDKNSAGSETDIV